MQVAAILSALGTITLVGKATAAATPVDADHDINDLIAEGYEVSQATFTGDFGPEGEALTFNGTIEEVMKQVHKVNPDYDFDNNDGGLEARGWPDREVREKDCNRGKHARGYWIDEGIKYLRNLKGQCTLPETTCSRVSCSWNSAIWVCWNPLPDSPRNLKAAWNYVADYADGVASGAWCPREPQLHDPFTKNLVRGKVWDPKGMAVVVREARC